MLMDVAIERSGKDASIAVIRNYAPARIERELLARVFDIVQQGAPVPVATSDHVDSILDSSLIATIGDDLDANAQGHGHDSRRVQRGSAA